jgi:2-iminobutanoate/2-iminopropanoate deaminase
MTEKEIITTINAPTPVGPYSQAVKVGDLLFTSGQIGLEPYTGTIIHDSIENETRQVLENIKTILKEAGSSLDKVIKTTIYITSMDNFSRVNTIYGQYFTEKPPARSCIEVSSLPKGASIEIETIALCSS